MLESSYFYATYTGIRSKADAGSGQVPAARLQLATAPERGGAANRLAAPRSRSSDVVSGTNQQLPWLSRQPDVVGRAWIRYDRLMPRALHAGLQVFIQKQK